MRIGITTTVFVCELPCVLKQIGKRLYVIEINDNPNVDADNKDSVLRDALYREVMGVFLKRIEASKRGAA